MKLIWSFIKNNLFNFLKLAFIVLLLIFCYNSYSEYLELKNKNDALLYELSLKKNQLKILEKTYQLYDNKDYLNFYLIKTYGLLKNNDFKLYIMEVK